MSVLSLAMSRSNNVDVLFRLAWRQVQMRYQDSALGLAWTIIYPLVLLLVFNFIYSSVFRARWPTPTGEEGNYALFMFSGLILYLLVVEMLNAATTVVEGQAVLIKRTTMDSRLVPIAGALSALFTFALSLVPFIAFYALQEGIPPWTAILSPLIIALLWLIGLGLVLVIAATSPYFRDIRQVVPLLTTAMLFLSPIFYQMSQLPENIAPVIEILNPLATLIPAFQDLVFYSQIPPLLPLAIWTGVAAVLLAVAFPFYRRAARGFADVV